MARTQASGGNIKDGSIGREDLDSSTAGRSVAKKIVAGTGVTISSTGADSGTGDVTLNADLTLLDGRYLSLLPVTTTSAKTTLAQGWYTIATNIGNRANAHFAIVDRQGGMHQTVTFYATHMYGNGNTITVLSNSFYGTTTPFRYIRIKSGGTYSGAMLQVYIDTANPNVKAFCFENVQTSGWILADWIPDGTDPSALGNYSDITNVTAQIDLDALPNNQGGMYLTGGIYFNKMVTPTELYVKVLSSTGANFKELKANADTGGLTWDGAQLITTANIANQSVATAANCGVADTAVYATGAGVSTYVNVTNTEATSGNIYPVFTTGYGTVGNAAIKVTQRVGFDQATGALYAPKFSGDGSSLTNVAWTNIANKPAGLSFRTATVMTLAAGATYFYPPSYEIRDTYNCYILKMNYSDIAISLPIMQASDAGLTVRFLNHRTSTKWGKISSYYSNDGTSYSNANLKVSNCAEFMWTGGEWMQVFWSNS